MTFITSLNGGGLLLREGDCLYGGGNRDLNHACARSQPVHAMRNKKRLRGEPFKTLGRKLISFSLLRLAGQ